MFPPTKHASVSPSRLARILDCPGSLALGQKYETGEQSEYAAEGSMLHGVTEEYLIGWQGDLDSLVEPNREVIKHINEELDIDQISAVEDCLVYLSNIIKTCGPGWSMHVERRVTMASYDPILFDTDGTSDIIIYDPYNRRIIVVDWKFGKGVIVYADNNDQILAYGTGALLDPFEVPEMSRTMSAFEQQFDLELHVVQPRIDNYSSVTVTHAEVVAWLNGRVIPGLKVAHDEGAPFIPGTKQCRFCPAKLHCRARYNYANKTAADVFAAHAKLPDDVSIEELVDIYNRSEIIEKMRGDIAAYFQRKLEAGIPIPGKKLVAGRSNRQWADPALAEQWLAERIDYSDLYDSKLISPAKAEKINRSLKNDDDFRALIFKPEGSPTLTNEDDKRPALIYRSASEIFAQHMETKENVG